MFQSFAYGFSDKENNNQRRHDFVTGTTSQLMTFSTPYVTLNVTHLLTFGKILADVVGNEL
jgi:hypothetical protein